MTNNPRIEAAARALCEIYGHDPDADDSTCQSGIGANWRAYEDEARAALSAADVVDSLRQGMSIPELPVNAPVAKGGENG